MLPVLLSLFTYRITGQACLQNDRMNLSWLQLRAFYAAQTLAWSSTGKKVDPIPSVVKA